MTKFCRCKALLPSLTFSLAQERRNLAKFHSVICTSAISRSTIASCNCASVEPVFSFFSSKCSFDLVTGSSDVKENAQVEVLRSSVSFDVAQVHKLS